MKKIIILGGGFGGIRCALDLDKEFKGEAGITLVDRNSYHLFLPSLYEVAAIFDTSKDPFAVKMRKTICIPYREIFYGKNINFVQAELSSIDLETKNVKTDGGEILPYDYLVIALGGQTADFGIPGINEYAHQFKSIDDAIAVNVKIEKLIKNMSSGEKVTPLKILIGGAGFSGVELAAELSCCVKKIANVCDIKKKCFQINLVEAGPKILPMVSERNRTIITQRLTRLGVVLMENSPIEEVGSGFVKLKNGQMLEGDMVIWTAGIKANEFIKTITNLPVTDRGKIVVDGNLLVQGRQNVFAVGDNQEFIDPKTQKPIPGLAYTAIDQGKVAANNIYSLVKGKKLKLYRPNYSTWIAPVGGKFAVAHLGPGFDIGGFMGWVVRELVDFKYLISILSLKKAIVYFWREVAMFTKND